MSSYPLPIATIVASSSITGNDYASADIGHQFSRRKRAAVACSECRTRKVRCDVLGELPCVRCRIEGIPCTTPVRKRRATSPPKNTSIERLDTTRLDIPVNGAYNFLHELSTAPLSASRVHDFDAFNEPLAFCFDHPGLPLESMDVQPQGLPLFEDPWGTINVTPRPASSQGTGPTSDSQTSSTWSRAHFAEDDMAYLTAKGVFEFPPPAIQDELVDAFFHHIQPLLPILNEKDFRENFSAGNQSVQRALFRAVLFVATSYLKETSVKQCGFSSVHEAQAIHFERAKLLYDVDTTTSPMERLQILLMFSYFAPKTENQSHCGNKYWLGAATTIAKDLNLNKEETMARLDIKEARLLRRIWWACVGRDIVLAFTYRRAPSISPSDYNLAAITADDLIDDPHPSDAYQGLAKYVVARLYTHLTELAVLAHKHLSRRFSPGAGIKLELKNPSSLLAHLLDIGRGNTELAVWKQTFEGEDLNCLDLGEDTYRRLVMLRYTVLMGHKSYHCYHCK
ncbi:hypothetical protein IQ07DRAFT_292090 [Pyrenochaeta sp. DS3sAY3a]|nr:hypothetical protein IQ07DRAFT_292090 [Pyrenochaeta sp. DS3sAY3a]